MLTRTSQNSVMAKFALPHRSGPMGSGRSGRAAPPGSITGKSSVVDREAHGYGTRAMQMWASEKAEHAKSNYRSTTEYPAPPGSLCALLSLPHAGAETRPLWLILDRLGGFWRLLRGL